MRTIGVALAIPEPWASELQDYRTALGDPTATMIPTHVTLLPPAAVDGGDLPKVEAHLAEAAAEVEPFEVHLRGTDTFRPVSPVVYVSVVRGGGSCARLAEAVRRGPLACDLDFPYHPHVTVAHHLDEATMDRAQADLAGFECRFEVDGFHLYAHDDDRGWQPARGFGLGSS